VTGDPPSDVGAVHETFAAFVVKVTISLVTADGADSVGGGVDTL
jgi:hypothetical protein